MPIGESSDQRMEFKNFQQKRNMSPCTFNIVLLFMELEQSIRKEPISADMITESLVNRSNLENLLDLRNLCIFLFAYTGFFRIEEALHLKYLDICFHDNYVAINVVKSKTDQLRKGNEVVIAKGSNSDTCPVNMLSRYLARVKQDSLEHDNYIFRPLLKSRTGHKLVLV